MSGIFVERSGPVRYMSSEFMSAREAFRRGVGWLGAAGDWPVGTNVIRYTLS